MWKLVIEDDEGKRTVVPLTREDYTLGRKEGNTIRLTERNVSREHAKLHRSKLNGAGAPRKYTLVDCTSYNGVYVNGLRVATTQELVHGDLIQIGDYRMVLQDDQVVEAPAAVPAISADSKATIPTGAMNRGQQLMERPNRLVMLAGPTAGAEYPLDRERLTVGRAEDATISVNHNSVSRLHCEIHLLGESRYEIVDKGSSNGVRVNAQEVKRGIIEAGDIIELGDVRFKFVGAGQIFLPGINDNPTLSTIGDRVVPQKHERRGGLLPYVILGMCVAGAIIVVLAWLQRRQLPTTGSPPATITSESQISHDVGLVEQARALADSNDLDGAHAKLTEVTNDTVRSSPDFRLIETRWATDVLARARREPDPPAKKALLALVAQDALLKDSPLRTRASDDIEEVDRVATPVFSTPLPASEAVLPPTHPTTTTTTHREATSAPRRPPPPSTSAAGSAATTSKPNARSASEQRTEQARDLILTDPAAAKSLLMEVVKSGRGSDQDVRILRSVCQGLKDLACLEFLRTK
jgi:ABC transport system ATP-binding/permease protein